MLRRGAIAVVTVGLLAACAAPPPGREDSGAELRIFAAASLVEPFTAIAHEFAEANPEVEVRPIVFDGSATLATQIAEGAPADVFASADRETMQGVADALAVSPQEFARNTLQLVVAPGNPLGITGLADLADDRLRVVLCAPEVPCGKASRELLANAGVAVNIASEEQNVKAVLTRVKLGEADAGLVYLTDIQPGAAVEGVPIDGAAAAANTYSIGVLEQAGHPAAAEAFVRFVLSADGKAILAEYGFDVG